MTYLWQWCLCSLEITTLGISLSYSTLGNRHQNFRDCHKLSLSTVSIAKYREANLDWLGADKSG